MAEIHLDVFTEVNKRALQKAAADVRKQYEKVGRSAASAFDKKVSRAVEDSADRIAKANDRIADAQGKVRTERAKLRKMEKASVRDRTKEIEQQEKLAKAERDRNREKKGFFRLRRDEAERVIGFINKENQAVERAAAAEKKIRDSAADEEMQRQNEIAENARKIREDDQREEEAWRAKVLAQRGKDREELAKLEWGRMVDLAHKMDRERDRMSADEKARIQSNADFQYGLMRDNAARMNREYDQVIEERKKSEKDFANFQWGLTVDNARRMNREFDAGITDRQKAIEKAVKRNEKIEIERRKNRGIGGLANKLSIDGDTGALDTLGDINRLGKATAFVGRGLSTLALPVAIPLLIKGLDDVIGIAVTASQSIALLPAAATAAAAGFATLKIGMSGFFDAIKDVRDPEKFAESLQALAPSAQQAALHIQRLLPQFDALKMATQGALFAGVGPELNRLITTFLPTIQAMTTDIASSFNQMFMGFSQALQSSDVQLDIGLIAANIGDAFRNLAPAIAPLTQAFADLAATGSQFLPELATGLANAAADFAATVRRMSEDGSLKTFIKDGIDAVGALATSIFNVGKTIYDVFGKNGKQNIEDFKVTADALTQSLGTIANVLHTIAELVDRVAGPISFVATALGSPGRAIGALARGDLKGFGNEIVGLGGNFSPFGTSPQHPTQNTLLPLGVPGMPLIPVPFNMPGAPSSPPPDPPPAPPKPKGPASIMVPQTDPTKGPSSLDGALGQLAGVPGASIQPAPPPPPPPDHIPVPPMPPAGGSGGGSVSNPPPHVDPSQFQSGNAMPTGGPPEVVRAVGNVQSAQNSLEEAKLREINLMQEGNASQLDLLRARNDVQERETALLEAQMKLQEARSGAFSNSEKALTSQSKTMGKIGVALDKDLGISKGLAGMADNLVRFLGNIAFADMLGRLEAIKQFHTGTKAMPSMAPASSGIGSPVTGGMMGAAGQAKPGESARGFAHRVMKPFFEAQGFSVGDHAADQFGEHQNGALDIMVPTIAAGRKVLQQVLSDPNTYGAIFNNKTYGYGNGPMPQDYSAGHTGNPTQDHQDHVHAWYKPGNPNNINPNGMPITAGAGAQPVMPAMGGPSLGGQSIPIPLPVVIVGGAIAGGGGGIGRSIGRAGTPHGTRGGAPPGPISTPTPGLGAPMGTPTPGLGAPAMAPATAQAGPPPVAGRAPGQGGFQAAGGGFGGLGGAPMGAMKSAASTAANAFAPGSGAAAESAMELINRTIAFGGQAAAIGVQGITETLLPHGSELGDPSNNLLMRVAGGFAGARPAEAPTVGKQEVPMKTPDQHGKGGSPGPGNGPLIGQLNYTGPAKDGEKFAKDVNRQVNSYGAGDER